MLVFQLILLSLLALPVLSGRLPLLGVALAYAALLVGGAYKVLNFKGRERAAGILLLAFFGALSLAVFAALSAGFDAFVVALGSGLALAGLYALLAWRFSVMDCELLGWTNGYAVIRVPASLVAFVPAGVHALTCVKKPVGTTVRVRFSLLKKQGFVLPHGRG